MKINHSDGIIGLTIRERKSQRSNSEERIMKKQKLGLALAAVLLLSGCGGIEKMTETTVTVDDKGTVEELFTGGFFLTKLTMKKS